MKKLILTLVILCMAFAPFAQSTLTKEERKKAVAYLKRSAKELKSATKGLSDDQLRFKPGEGQWSIEECVEHLALAENGLWQVMQSALEDDPNPAKRAEIVVEDEMVLANVPVRDQKVKTRPFLEPVATFGSVEGSLQAFEVRRKAYMELVKTTDQDLRNRYFESPYGTADLYQLILFVSAHTLRHISQINEIKQQANYP